MNDLLYMIKICMVAIIILLGCEIAVYLFANRRDRLKRLRASKNQPTATYKISLGFFFLFLFSILSFVFYILEVRLEYLYSEAPVEDMLRLMINLKNICFVYAFTSLFLFLSSFVIRAKIQIPIMIGIILWSLSLLFSDWGVKLSPYFAIILTILPLVVLFNFIQITQEKLQRQFLILFIGFSIFLGGWATMIQFPILFIQFTEYSGPETLIFASLILMGYGFVSIPSLNEAFPVFFVEELYLTTNEGDILLKHRFTTQGVPSSDGDQSKLEEEFVAASIVGIDGVLREISSAQGLLKTFIHQDKILIIETRNQIIGLFVTRMDLHSFRSQLRNILHELESHFFEEIQTRKTLTSAARTTLIAQAESWFKKPREHIISKLWFQQNSQLT